MKEFGVRLLYKDEAELGIEIRRADMKRPVAPLQINKDGTLGTLTMKGTCFLKKGLAKELGADWETENKTSDSACEGHMFPLFFVRTTRLFARERFMKELGCYKFTEKRQSVIPKGIDHAQTLAISLLLWHEWRGSWSEVEVLNIVGVVDVVNREGTHRAATIHANLEFRVILHMKGTYFLCLRKRFAKDCLTEQRELFPGIKRIPLELCELELELSKEMNLPIFAIRNIEL
ncbi:hypothetical protein MTR67_046558 [Solanum verrucosum]|uniref:Uncharacterized protein n=1 Tax=Solanum verrucosum TaxID=315347 RepID=A0AAF0UXL6_SOLVR|nr:hypothetical protein MTR67_046558 [Solanum verrucosum]